MCGTFCNTHKIRSIIVRYLFQNPLPMLYITVTRRNRIQKCEFLDAFAKWRKATISPPVLLHSRSGLAGVSVFLTCDATSLVIGSETT